MTYFLEFILMFALLLSLMAVCVLAAIIGTRFLVVSLRDFRSDGDLDMLLVALFLFALVWCSVVLCVAFVASVVVG